MSAVEKKRKAAERAAFLKFQRAECSKKEQVYDVKSKKCRPRKKSRLTSADKKRKATERAAFLKFQRAECGKKDQVYDIKSKKCRPRKSTRRTTKSAIRKRKRDDCRRRLGDHYTYDEEYERRVPNNKGCRVTCNGTRVNAMRSGCMEKKK